MSKQILHALPELVQAHIISEETAEEIRRYYGDQPNQASNRLFIIFGILGALLIGMGIVLILAHNWDTLPKAAKLSIGFTPLLVGQILTGYLIFKGIGNKAWGEGAAVFLFLSVAVAIAIVSQVYNIEGSLAGFLLTWMLLALPIAYILHSSMASMMFIIGITWYAAETGYNYHATSTPMYWILLVLIVPFYYFEFLRTNRKNNFYYFHSWLIVISLTISLGTWATYPEELMMIAYMSLFSAFVIMGELETFQTNRVLSNGYLVVGSLGVIFLLLLLSFDFYWEEVGRVAPGSFVTSAMFAVVSITTAVAVVLLIVLIRTKTISEVNLKAFAFIFMIPLYIIGINSPHISQILTNLTVLLLAVYTIRSGAQKNHLGILNYGLLIITALIICRFFDTDLSFIIRGLLFIGIGVAFFAANYFIIRKRKSEA